eukprot:CAMPEP_0206464954 /NCGR_PEP_ID=MMETSP0324_2-20121206/27530_1 /ASSEMBLY_ACC=CAM_ASM_000836 /TAXON_ID=2866 /ORGANISM="Crypthecodinium cohnii, Strain Seligo" /LENGTH=92 /DNA_ID=CAMNT_0053937697 /DNA_START=247 /DNA_END=522 /DNA_ORIENTATION=-
MGRRRAKKRTNFKRLARVPALQWGFGGHPKLLTSLHPTPRVECVWRAKLQVQPSSQSRHHFKQATNPAEVRGGTKGYACVGSGRVGPQYPVW